MHLSDKLSISEQNMFFFFSVLPLDDTSKSPLIPHVSEFILQIHVPARTGSLLVVLPSLGAISRPMMQMIVNEFLAHQLLELQISLLNVTVLSEVLYQIQGRYI